MNPATVYPLQPVFAAMPQRQRFAADQHGQAIFEFVLSAITFLFVILGVIQLALFLNASSLVQYAAYNAARAAAVHGGNREKMEEAARLSLIAIFPRHGIADTAGGFVDNYLGAAATDKRPGLTYFEFSEPITSAKIIDPPCGTGATFDDFNDIQNSLITVEVVHHYELVIPLVNRIVFYVRKMVKSGGSYSGESIDHLASAADRERRSGSFKDVEFRIPIVAHYSIRMQSDLEVAACDPPPPPPTTVPASTTVASTTTTAPAAVTFTDPQWGGAPLDHCLNFGKNCGFPAADAFCQSMGFTGATAFVEGPAVDQTMTVNNEPCDHSWAPQRPAFCQPMKSVTCI